MIRATTSASNLSRRVACLASHRIEAAVREEIKASGLQIDEDSEWSAMGTLGHLHFAEKERDRSKLDPELQRCLAIGDAEEAAFFASVEANEGIGPDEEYESVYERELWFVDPYGRKLFPGHCDGWRYYPRRKLLAIPDLKLGYLEVTSAESNWQLSAYGCMGRHLTQCEVFYGAIIQPRLPSDQRATMCRYDAEALDMAVIEITKLYDTLEDEHEAVPGEDQCRYCVGKLRCKAFFDRIRSLIPSLPPPVAKKNAVAKLEPLTAAEFGLIGDNLKFGRMLEDPWKEEAIRRIEAGLLPDWEIEPGNIRKVVTDTLTAYELLSEAVTENSVGKELEGSTYMSACTLSVAQLKKPVADLLGIPQTKAEQFIKTTLAPVTEEKQNAPSVVRKKESEA